MNMKIQKILKENKLTYYRIWQNSIKLHADPLSPASARRIFLGAGNPTIDTVQKFVEACNGIISVDDIIEHYGGNIAINEHNVNN